nr:hypothetical protein [Streptomyces sp. TN58]
MVDVAAHLDPAVEEGVAEEAEEDEGDVAGDDGEGSGDAAEHGGADHGDEDQQCDQREDREAGEQRQQGGRAEALLADHGHAVAYEEDAERQDPERG